MERYKFQGKTPEEALEKALYELKLEKKDIIYRTEEIAVGGLFKTKKQELTVISLNEALNDAKKFLTDLITAMGIEVKMECKKREGIINIELHSDENPVLIGKNGKTLDALQILVRQALNTKSGMFINVTVDVEGYKQKQIDRLERDIRRIAKDVIRSKVEVKLDPMNSYERRIVHTIVSEFNNLETESIGEDPNRCTVIKYSEK